MTHAVMRGSPTKAQLYLENIIQELVQETGQEEDRHSLNRILFKCLRDHPDRLLLIDGKTDEKITNGEMLRRAVQVARALKSNGLGPGDVAVTIAQNHIDFSALYFGVLFAGMTLFNLEPILTAHEVQHFLKLSQPAVVFVDTDKIELMQQALGIIQMAPKFVAFGKILSGNMTFTDFIAGHSNDPEGFWPVLLAKDAAALFFTSGGSTGLGLPKVIPNTNQGIVAQTPTEWTYTDEFPCCKERLLVVYHGQWTLHTMFFTTAVIYGASLLVQSENASADNLIYLCRQYKPTLVFFTPPDITDVIRSPKYRHGDLHSLKKLIVGGGPAFSNFLKQLKAELCTGAVLCMHYGMTEAHGHVCLGDKHEPPIMEAPINLYLYKILNEDGNVVGVNQSGELYLKSDYCLAQTYYGDEEAAKNMFTPDGWFRTGDIMRMDEKGLMRYVNRIKFIISHKGYPFSPLEVEEVICGVKGVAAAIVTGVDDFGNAALVVPLEGMNPSRDDIKETVKATLNINKHLSGIGFINALPRTVVGKVHRRKCIEIIKEMVANKQCQ